jgi:flagellar biosynthesis protein FlhF
VKIKKYEADTEQNAMELVKRDIGDNALVLNIKKTQPKGVLSFWAKPRVEITAAYEEKPGLGNDSFTTRGLTNARNGGFANPDVTGRGLSNDAFSVENLKKYDFKREDFSKNYDYIVKNEASKPNDFKTTLESAEEAKTIAQSGIVNKSFIMQPNHLKKPSDHEKSDGVTRALYDTMSSAGVTTSMLSFLLRNLHDSDIGETVKTVYSKIIGILGPSAQTETRLAEKKPMFFFGPTGAGKTTTLVKLAARYKNEIGLNVGLITSDTERIGATEQLKACADIMGLDIRIAYSTQDLARHIEAFKASKDVTLVDTAGRSHKSEAAMDAFTDMLLAAGESERFLALSAPTKHEDSLEIIGEYSKRCDFSLIFTKLDETPRIGGILNICRETDKRIAYITNSQNPPRGLDEFRPENLAKTLMGLDA